MLFSQLRKKLKGSVSLNTDFSRNLVLLRKEKGLSQKKVSEDLDISQALLSHYEKGIRECGLDFVIRVADYYSVSCDFLLGRCEKREMYKNEKIKKSADSPATQLQSTVTGSINIVFAILKKINSQSLCKQVGIYLESAVYNIFRMIYSANEKNPQGFFKIRKELYSAAAESKMLLAKSKSSALLSGISLDDGIRIPKENLPKLTLDSIKSEYSKYAKDIERIIDDVEE